MSTQRTCTTVSADIPHQITYSLTMQHRQLQLLQHARSCSGCLRHAEMVQHRCTPSRRMLVTTAGQAGTQFTAAATSAPALAQQQGHQELHVYAKDGRRHTLCLPTVAFVTQGDIRSHVAEQARIDPTQLRLAYGGCELDPAMDNTQFKIMPGVDVLHALQRMTGGGKAGWGGSGQPSSAAVNTCAAAALFSGVSPLAGPAAGTDIGAVDSEGEGGSTTPPDSADAPRRRRKPVQDDPSMRRDMRSLLARRLTGSSNDNASDSNSSNSTVPRRVDRAPGARPGTAEVQLAKQFRDLLKHPIPGVSAAPREDNLLLWDVKLAGPEGTPYHGGWFDVELKFTKGFPGQQPSAKFLTQIWHPNIGQNSGRVCVNFADHVYCDRRDQQFGVCSVPVVLSGLQMLLRHPNPMNPLNHTAGNELTREPAEFENRAAAWTRRHAL